MGFPRDDYTPFGLLANPWAEARSWEAGSGGVLRATEQRPGLALLFPWATRPTWALLLEAGLEHDGRRFLTREQFSEVGLRCTYHSANLLEYSWDHDGLQYSVTFFSGGPDALTARWQVSSSARQARTARLWVSWGYWVRSCLEATAAQTIWPAWLEMESPPSEFHGWQEKQADRLAGQDGTTTRSIFSYLLPVPGEAAADWIVTYGRAKPERAEHPSSSLARGMSRTSRASELQRRAQDDAFWGTCPQLIGDWPPEFRRGLVYDFETTRMCLQPPGGIFQDVWPAWMVNWPRAVLAEGTLDMLRLSFAQPDLAKRAVLSLFRDAPAPNVPCVFKHGEPNMVAKDGSVCGTSPAWCVPFHNLRLLYLRTLDRTWLAALYPLLAAYVRWWRDNRSDQAGWIVYKCTWESGEDNSPRLDPNQEGDHVISQFARPVELQAAMADAAATLAFFGRELGLTDDEWLSIEQAARDRLARLWDPAAERFRDWDVRRDGFIEPSRGSQYWGVDPRRFSPLALCPLLFGQTSAAQVEALRREIEHYAKPPWCDWPSWSYVVLEAASKAGWFDFAGRLAFDVGRRVYAENDRRDLKAFERPMPGAAREYWPSDLGQWDASEGYGWGATTASFVVRQLCGFYESHETAGCVFRLAPGFPAELIQDRRLGIGPLQYRGLRLYLEFIAVGDGLLGIEVHTPQASCLMARDEQNGEILREARVGAVHRLRLPSGHAARIELGDPQGVAFPSLSPG